MVDTLVPNNPYVGPRSIETGEAFFGRDREIRSLSALLIAERIVLLHSPSGAGKSSLIKAGLMPRMAERFSVFPLVRVNLEPPQEVAQVAGLNRYVLSTLLSLDEGLPPEKHLPLGKLAALTLDGYLEYRAQLASDSPANPNSLLVFDQFEEVLTVSPTDAPAKQQFFEQLGEALQNPHRWALFAIREDYMGGMAPYVRAIPNRLGVTLRLGLLGPDAARLAIQKPSKDKGVDFTDDAAQKLVDDLRGIQVQQPDGSFSTEQGPDVEPVQLQVVCFNLWQSHAADDKIIDESDLQRVGSVDQALASYYAQAMHIVAGNAKVDERILRQWFDQVLITPEGIRSQVLKGTESTKGLQNIILRLFENTHLVRGETRAGKTWYELSHDRLVKPVRKDNLAWFENNLTLLQRQSVLWSQQGRSEGLLLRGKALDDARDEIGAVALTPDEKNFLDACLSLRKREQRDRGQRQLIVAGLIASLIFLALAAYGFFTASQQTRAARVAELDALAKGTLAAINADSASTSEARAIANANSASTAEARALANAEEASIAKASAIESANLAATAQANAELSLANVKAVAGYRAQALVAFSRELRVKQKISLSQLLSIEAFKIVDNYQTRGNLMEIIKNQLQVSQFTNFANSGLYVVNYNPSGSLLASGNSDGSVTLWNTANFNRFKAHLTSGIPGAVYSVAFNPEGSILATGNFANSVILWNVASGKMIGQPLKGHTNWVYAVAFSPDGSLLASGSADKSIIFWDVAKGTAIDQPMTGHSDKIFSLDFSPDGSMLASGSKDKTIILWDVASKKPIGQPLKGHTNYVFFLAFSPDGKILASGGAENNIILWDVASQKAIGQPLSGHAGPVTSLSFSPDGKILASGSRDGTIILWEVASRQRIGQIVPQNQNIINSVDFDPTGKILASGSVDGTITLWKLDGQAWVDMVCRLASRNLTDAEWQVYFPGEEYRKTCAQ